MFVTTTEVLTRAVALANQMRLSYNTTPYEGYRRQEIRHKVIKNFRSLSHYHIESDQHKSTFQAIVQDVVQDVVQDGSQVSKASLGQGAWSVLRNICF